MNDQDQNSLLQKAKFLNSIGKFKDVIDLLTHKTLKDCNDVSLYLQRGLAHLNLNILNFCIIDANNALKLDIHCGRAFFLRAAAYTRKKEYSKAFDDILQVKEILPNIEDSGELFHELESLYLEIHYNIGEEFLRIADFNNALKYYDIVLDHKSPSLELELEIKEKAARCCYAIAQDVLIGNDLVLSLKFFDRAVDLAPNNVMYYYWRGHVNERLGNIKKSLNDYRYCLVINKEHDEFNKTLNEKIIELVKKTSKIDTDERDEGVSLTVSTV